MSNPDTNISVHRGDRCSDAQRPEEQQESGESGGETEMERGEIYASALVVYEGFTLCRCYSTYHI